MRLKVIGIQIEGDKHGKQMLKPRKNTMIEDVVNSAIGKMRATLMVNPCNFKKKREDDIHRLSSIDDIATIWNTCRDAIKDTNLKVLFVKHGIRFLVSSRSPFMEPNGYSVKNFTDLNIHQFGPTWNPKMFTKPIASNFYSLVNFSSDNISFLYKKIEEEKKKRAEYLYTYFAAIGDRDTKLEENFLRFKEKYDDYDGPDASMRVCVIASLLRPYLLGICKKGSRDKLVETLSSSYSYSKCKDGLVEAHIDTILTDKLYHNKIVDDYEVNAVGKMIGHWASWNVNGYKGSMLEHACHYLENWCNNYD